MAETTYLIFADNSDEFARSMRYAALAAKAYNTSLYILSVLPEADFQLWAGVEQRIEEEKLENAQTLMAKIKADIARIADVNVQTDIQHGSKTDAVLKTLKANPNIKKLILTTNVNGSGKGVILDYFTGAGSDKLPVPLTIVPGHVPMDAIDRLLE